MARWIEVGPGIYARRHAELDQTIAVVVGERRCLVVDSGTDATHGARLAAAVRELTPLPWTLLITHAHWDHFFGTSAFLPCPVWAHERCREEIAGNAEDHRARGVRHFRDAGEPELAERVADAEVVPPTELLTGTAELDLGGRTVTLLHPGRGHTAGDVAVHVADAEVVLAGDLVEQGAPPAYGSDAYPLEWPAAVAALLDLRPRVVVPGHGEPVGPDFVRGQQAELATVAGLCADVRAGRLSVPEAVRRAPYPPQALEHVLGKAAAGRRAGGLSAGPT